MKTKLLVLVVFSTVLLSSVYGQDTIKKKKPFKQTYKWAAGLGAGFTTGYGISFKYHPKKDGVQINFFPFIDNYGSRKIICAGLTYLHDLWNAPTNNVYFYLASSYSLNRKTETETEWVNIGNYTGYYQNINNTITKQVINTGCGIGFEANTKERVVADIMLGYAQFDSFKQFFFTGEVALHYRFGKWKK